MPSGYRLYYVTTYELIPGKAMDAREWYTQGRALWLRLPGVRSVDAYVQQFALGAASQQLEIWTEIDDYAVLDQWDGAAAEFGDEVVALAKIAAGCVRQGPARLVGDYMGSDVRDLQQGG